MQMPLVFALIGSNSCVPLTGINSHFRRFCWLGLHPPGQLTGPVRSSSVRRGTTFELRPCGAVVFQVALEDRQAVVTIGTSVYGVYGRQRVVSGRPLGAREVEQPFFAGLSTSGCWCMSLYVTVVKQLRG